jgi:hypothetical protein
VARRNDRDYALSVSVFSLLWLFKRFVDPAAHRDEEEERRRQREAIPPEFQPDGSDDAPPRREPPAPARRCRVCGHEGTDAFCPRCLADTMVARK